MDPCDEVEVDWVANDLAAGGRGGTDEMVSGEVMKTLPVGVRTAY